MAGTQAIACFKDSPVKGDVVATQSSKGVTITAFFTDLPAGEHGFHIHRAGDLRGEGCAGACEHFHRGPPSRHGGAPFNNHCLPRHTGDLGNIVAKTRYTFFLHKVTVADLFGRALIVHADPDDLGLGNFPDSATTGHSGARIGCAIFGRSATCSVPKASRKTRRIRGGGGGTFPFNTHPLNVAKVYKSKTKEEIQSAIDSFTALLDASNNQKEKEGLRSVIAQLTKYRNTAYTPPS